MHPREADTAAGPSRTWSRPERVAQVLALGAGLALVIVAVALGPSVSTLTRVGYPGVFVLSFLGSAALVLPVPGLISLCGVSVLLNPLLLGTLAGLAETLGETTGYAVGYGGQAVVERHRLYQKVRSWMARRGTLVIFLVSLIPNPIFDLVGIAAGGTRFPLGRFLVTVAVGKVLKGIMVAYTCYHGIRLLPWVD